MAWAPHGKCESDTAKLCKSNGKDTFWTLSGTAWWGSGMGMACYVRIGLMGHYSCVVGVAGALMLMRNYWGGLWIMYIFVFNVPFFVHHALGGQNILLTADLMISWLPDLSRNIIAFYRSQSAMIVCWKSIRLQIINMSASPKQKIVSAKSSRVWWLKASLRWSFVRMHQATWQMPSASCRFNMIVLKIWSRKRFKVTKRSWKNTGIKLWRICNSYTPNKNWK